MRLAGAFMVFAACGAMGLMRVAGAKARMEQLAAVERALALMRGELALNLTPMPNLIEYVSLHSCGGAREFFSALLRKLSALGERELSALWTEAAAETLGLLGVEERAELDALGQILGRAELSEQLSAIERCERCFDGALKSARIEYPTHRRLTLGVSAAAGLLLVIVFI